MKFFQSLPTLLLSVLCVISQAQTYFLQPDRVFDGNEMHDNWVVVVNGNKITDVGPVSKITKPRGASTIDLAGTTLLPGMI
ncbi:MAG TPA: amidohydrolase family protein, partial [Cyclobacteriaceae bacterium]|nr:amidohydrolase family protein [Cyclobacteriaceae bacterium]